MEDMHLILRWHGEKDPISLRQYAQIPNLYGIVTSLYHLPLGQVWDRGEVLRLKEQLPHSRGHQAGLCLQGRPHRKLPEKHPHAGGVRHPDHLLQLHAGL